MQILQMLQTHVVVVCQLTFNVHPCVSLWRLARPFHCFPFLVPTGLVAFELGLGLVDWQICLNVVVMGTLVVDLVISLVVIQE